MNRYMAIADRAVLPLAAARRPRGPAAGCRHTVRWQLCRPEHPGQGWRLSVRGAELLPRGSTVRGGRFDYPFAVNPPRTAPIPVQIAADGTFAAQMQYGTEDYRPRSRLRTAWVTVTGRIDGRNARRHDRRLSLHAAADGADRVGMLDCAGWAGPEQPSPFRSRKSPAPAVHGADPARIAAAPDAPSRAPHRASGTRTNARRCARGCGSTGSGAARTIAPRRPSR